MVDRFNICIVYRACSERSASSIRGEVGNLFYHCLLLRKKKCGGEMENFRSSSGGGFEKKMKIYCDVGCEREKIGIRNLGEVEMGEMRNVGEVKRWRGFI
ncbi:hypothetical protein P8452_73877 [Trifolium repens]|nr:hypothetical protein P8452_73877 [Trifolium repens]